MLAILEQVEGAWEKQLSNTRASAANWSMWGDVSLWYPYVPRLSTLNVSMVIIIIGGRFGALFEQ
jgi:hypothetical protein